MHQALYRKWRPSTFADVVGQDHITSVLSYEVAEKTLNHAYLFCGSRGTGKTSCAKILAKAANCRHSVNGEPCNKCESCLSIDAGTSLDVLEMDAASNTGVDYIRDIRDEVVFTPSEMSTRVYIIDEVHMLSEGAFNALLKTLEEPPTSVIFVLATTELQKIPATILSRCQRFDFRRISVDDITGRLLYIAKEEDIELETDAARLIAKLSQGGMRDAISLLELCAGEGGKVTTALVEDKAGVCGRESVISVGNLIAAKDYPGIFAAIADIYRSSKDLTVFLNDLISLYRDMLVIRAMRLTDAASTDKEILDVSENEFRDLKTLAEKFRYPTMIYHTKLLKEAVVSIGRGADKRMTAEITLVRMCSGAAGDSSEALSARIDQLERKIAEGAFALPVQPSAQETPKATEDRPVQQPAEKKQEMSAPPEQAEELTEYYDWMEIVSSYSRFDASTVPFLESCRAFSSVESLIIEIYDAMALAMLEKNRAADRILSITRSRGDGFKSVEFRLKKVKKKESALDDFAD